LDSTKHFIKCNDLFRDRTFQPRRARDSCRAGRCVPAGTPCAPITRWQRAGSVIGSGGRARSIAGTRVDRLDWCQPSGIDGTRVSVPPFEQEAVDLDLATGERAALHDGVVVVVVVVGVVQAIRDVTNSVGTKDGAWFQPGAVAQGIGLWAGLIGSLGCMNCCRGSKCGGGSKGSRS
jgi:hypothetical protein